MPRVVPVREARAAFVAADFGACLAALRGNNSIEAGLLSVRSLLRLRRIAEAEQALAVFADEVDGAGCPHEVAEHALLRAHVLSHRGAEDAEEAFVAARVHAINSGDHGLLGEVELSIGAGALAAGDLDRAELRLAAASDECQDARRRCRLRQLDGAVRAARGDLQGQLERELENFEAQTGFTIPDVWLESRTLYNLALVTLELDRQDIAVRVAARAARLRWTSATLAHEFQTFHHLAWSAALAGDHPATFRHLRRSTEAAPNPRLRVQVLVDSSLFYRELGEHVAMRERLDAADELAARTDWDDASGEERLALLSLAELLADVDARKAHRCVNAYQAAKRKLGVDAGYRIDDRARAIERQLRAAVAGALGDTGKALDLFAETLAFWEARGIAWRAAWASVEIARLTRSRVDVDRAERYAQRFPMSWFARRLAALD